MRTLAAATAATILAAGCGAAHEPAPSPAPAPLANHASAPPDPCKDVAMRLEVLPPADGEPAATFAFRWQGQGYGGASRVICLVHGDDVELVPRGERREVAIRAHATQLQRILVDERPHLIAVPPGSDIVLGDNPCFGYELWGPDTDPWFVAAPTAYCAKPNQECRDGFTRASSPRPVEDDLCGSTEEIRRCVADAEVALATGATHVGPLPVEDPSQPIPVAALAAAGTVRVTPGGCGFTSIDTGTEKAALVVGAGARWSLAVDAAGRLTGSTGSQR